MTKEEGEEGTLKEAEKAALQAISLSNPLEKDPAADTINDETLDDSSQEAGAPNDALAVLRESLERLHPDSLRYRQLKHMLCEEERKQSQRLNHAKRQHQARIASLREKGVCTQSAELLPTNPNSAIPTQLEDELVMLRQKAIEEKTELEKRKAKDAFHRAWLRRTEIELHECVKKLQTSPDPTFRKSTQALLEVLQDKLKTHHTNLGTVGTKEALEERRQTCIKLGLLREKHAHLVCSFFEALPSTEELGESSTLPSQDDDDKSLFITQVPSWKVSHIKFERTRLLPGPSQEGRKRTCPVLSQPRKAKKPCTNQITNYFPSQR